MGIRRPPETVETSALDTEEKPLPASPDTWPEILRASEDKGSPSRDFFQLEKVKMRGNITEIDGHSHNLSGSLSSQDLLMRKSDLSSPALVPGQLVSSPLSLSAEPLPQFQSILDNSELNLSYQSRGTEILKEIPEFSVREEWEKEAENEVLEEKVSPETESPANLLLQVAYFKRKQQKLTSSSIKYEICEEYAPDWSSAESVRGAKAVVTAASLAVPGSLQYVIEEEEAQDRHFFPHFLRRSMRFGPSEAFLSLVPLSCSVVAQQFSEDTDFSHPRFLHWSGTRSHLPDLPSLSTLSYQLWASGWCGHFQRLRFPLGVLARSPTVDMCLTLCVLLNTVVLTINRYGIDPEQLTALDTCNFIFTLIFAAEAAVKLLGLGLKDYFRSKMNTFDCVIVTLSVLELTLLSGSGISGVNAIRVFRAFRVLRVARLFRWMDYTRKILSKIVDSASKFMYLGLLLLLFMVIFALLGMQLFGGQFSGPDYDRANYDDFNSAFLATFQILTSENWHNVLHNGMRSRGTVSALYFITWLFLGNFVLLNLFLAILLDAFSTDSAQHSLPAQLSSACPSAKLSRKEELLKKQIEELQQESIESATNSIDTVLRPPGRKDLYVGNHCERSFFVFAKQNWVRLTLTRVVTSPRFEQGIFTMIALSSVKLIWETYLLKEPEGSTRLQISENLDLAFTVVFTAEFLAKATSLGLVLGKGTYLREGWNVLDCTIVVFSLIGLMVSSVNVSIIKVFRLLRALRPLRFISHNVSMRIIVSALLESLSALLHVTIVMLLVWLIFAILGVSLFSGQLYQCSVDVESRAECEYYGGVWTNAAFHFDNVVAAMATLFHLTSPEDWNDTMYQCMDTAGKDLAMRRDANPMAAYYIVLFEVVSNFFFLNLFLGVLFDKFEQAKRENTSLAALILLPEQYRWVEMMKLVLHTKQQAENVQTQSVFHTFLLKVVGHWAFNAFIMVCIVANVVIMGLIYEEASKEYKITLENLNLAFTVIFTLEATLKIASFRLIYFKDSWNLFDLTVVVLSLLDIVLSNTAFQSSASHLMTVGPQIARTLRVLRVSRMLRLVKQLQIMDDLIGMLRLSLPAILNVLTLLGLVFIIYSVLGVFLFSTVESGLVVDAYNNFHDFGMALGMLIRASTGEDWNSILTDCKQGANVWLTHLFFFSFVCVTTFIMYNMFVMVMLQEYENYHNNPESSFKLFKQHLTVFNAAWNQAAVSARPTRLDSSALYPFAYALDPVVFPCHLSRYEVKKKLGRMGIISDDSGFVYYHEALFRYVRSKFYPVKMATGVRRKLIEKEEAGYARQLRRLVKSSKLAEMEGNWDRKSSDIKFFDILFLKSVFGSWQAWAQGWRKAELQRLFGGWKAWLRTRRKNSHCSETPPRSPIYPEPNSPTFPEIDPAAEEAQPREPKTSRMSTNISGQRQG